MSEVDRLVDILERATDWCHDEPTPRPFTTDADAVLVAALGASAETIELANRIVHATWDHDVDGCRYCQPMAGDKHPPGDPKPPPPPPPPPPTGTEVPAELRARIAEAEQVARELLASARLLARLEHEIDGALVALNRERGGDDAAFDGLVANTDQLSHLHNEIVARVTGVAGARFS